MQMRHKKLALSLLCAGMMAGCASIETTVAPTQPYKEILNSRDTALAQLSAANSCCTRMDELSFAPLPTDQATVVGIDGRSPVFNFPEGKSYLVAFRLPAHTGDLKVTLAGLIDRTLFNPTVLLLDSRFKVTRKIGPDILRYQPPYLLDGDRVEGVFTVDRSQVGNPNNESYLVIYTTQETLSQSTQITNPAKLMAKSLSVQDYGAKDPLIPHSPWGVVKLDVEDMSATKSGENFYKPAYQESIEANKPVVDPAPNKLTVPLATTSAVTTAAADKPAPAMLSETEAFYQAQIEKAVLAGDIDKAMQLVNEAERAGSTQAKSVFIDAVKRSQKG